MSPDTAPHSYARIRPPSLRQGGDHYDCMPLSSLTLLGESTSEGGMVPATLVVQPCPFNSPDRCGSCPIGLALNEWRGDPKTIFLGSVTEADESVYLTSFPRRVLSRQGRVRMRQIFHGWAWQNKDPNAQFLHRKRFQVNVQPPITTKDAEPPLLKE